MKKVIIVVFISSLFMVQCGKTEDVVPKSSLTLSVDGTSKQVSTPTAVLAFQTQNAHEGRTLLISGTVGGSPFSVAISNWDFQNPPENGVKVKTYNNVFGENILAKAECLSLGVVQLCDGGLVSYVEGSNIYMSAFYDGNYDSFIKVTACDPAKKIISGEYDVKVGDGNGAEFTLKGKFENVTYLVVK